MTATQAYTTRAGFVRTVLSVFAILVILCASSFAQTKSEPRYSFDVPAGDAKPMLRQFAAQAKREIVFPTKEVDGIKTRAVKGEMTAQEAADQMLADTGLVAAQDSKTGAFAIRKETLLESKNVASRSTSSRMAKNDDGSDGLVKLDTFEVFGRTTLNMDIRRTRNDAQPYVVFEREAIARSGATNLEDFLRQRLTMNTQGATNEQSISNTLSGSQINLRGLGTNQTLILVDGHRMPQTMDRVTPMQPNINGLPLAAIERIEVLPTTASGIYGGSATGGVVNIVLRRDYSGAEVRLTYQNTFKTDSAQRQIEISFGSTLNNGRTNILGGVSYTDRNHQLLQDLNILQAARAATMVNNPDSILSAATPPLGATANIRSMNGSNLILKNGAALNSPITHVPAGYAGTATDNGAALVANAARYNLDLAPSSQQLGGGRVIMTSPATKSGMLAIRHQFSHSLQAFADFGASNTTDRYPGTFYSGSYTIPSSAPTNPFTTNIRVVTPVLLNEEVLRRAQDRRAVFGVIAKLPRDWMGSVDYTWVKASTSFRLPSLDSTPQGIAASAAVSNGSLDILRDVSRFPVDWSPYQAPYFYTLTPFATVTREATARVSGPMLALPAGNVSVSGMVLYRHDDINDTRAVFNPSSVVYPARSQETESAYFEFRVPLFAKTSDGAVGHELDLQLAGRFDRLTTNSATGSITNNSIPITRVSTRGNSFNPTVALRYRPCDSIALRASYSTGYRPPGVNELVAQPPSGPSTFGVDPRRGNTPAGPFLFQTGGNPNLRAEESEAWSAGMVLTPSFLKNLRISVDWSHIEKTDNIATPAFFFQQMIDNETNLPGRITRGANLTSDPAGWAGPITFLDLTSLNISSAEVEAFDVQVDYQFEFNQLGRLELYGVATWQTHLLTKLLPAAPPVENVGLGSGSPLKFSGNAGLLWKKNRWTVGWNARYFDSYLVSSAPSTILTQGNRGRVKDQIYHDFLLERSFGQPRLRWLDWLTAGTTLQLGVKNVFDQQPPFDAGAINLSYSPFGDVRGVSYYLSFKNQF